MYFSSRKPTNREEDNDEDGPLDIAELTDVMQTHPHDGISDQEIVEAMLRTQMGNEGDEEYNRLKKVTISLSTLKTIYNTKSITRALSILRNQTTILIDDDSTINIQTSDRVLWQFNVNRMDFFMTVSSTVGLWAAIPNRQTVRNYAFNLILNRPNKKFKFKHGKLGFNPKGSILFIGKSGNEDVWVGMCPNDVFSGTSTDSEIEGGAKIDTRMSSSHYKILVIFFAFCLSKESRLSFTCSNSGYDFDIINSSNQDLKSISNVL